MAEDASRGSADRVRGTGQDYRVPICFVVHVTDGKIDMVHGYCAAATITRRIG